MSLDLGTFTSDRVPRPFVSTTKPGRTGLFPIPIAIIGRTRKVEDKTGNAGDEFSNVAVKLFYALLFLGWNLLEPSGRAPIMAYGSQALRRLVGCGRLTDRDLNGAFAMLATTLWEIPSRSDPTKSVETPLLQHYRHDDGRNAFFWQFADNVAEWCRGRGVTYAWLDIRVVRALRSTASLRLYELGSAHLERKIKSIDGHPEDFRLFLDAPPRAYAQNADFRGKLLARSLEHVSRVSQFTAHISFDPIAKIKSPFMTFAVEAKDDWQNDETIDAEPLTRRDLSMLSRLFGDIQHDGRGIGDTPA